MQRQSFDFQLTELPIRPALISHALPLRPAVLKVKALTLSLSTTRQFYRAIAGFSGFLSSGYGLIQVTAINKPSCCSKAIYWAAKVVIHKSKVHYNFTCVVLSENVFLQTVSGISTYNKRRGKNVTVRISNSHLPLTKSFRELRGARKRQQRTDMTLQRCEKDIIYRFVCKPVLVCVPICPNCMPCQLCH